MFKKEAFTTTIKRINTKCLGNWRGQAGGGVVSGHSLTACFEFLVDMCYIHLSPALQNRKMMQLAQFRVFFITLWDQEINRDATAVVVEILAPSDNLSGSRHISSVPYNRVAFALLEMLET